MDHYDLIAFGQSYAKVALARGEVADAERVQLYFDKLKGFDVNSILDAMDWAMMNLTRFPLLPDLVNQIEGSDEDHANKAWDGLLKLVYAGPESHVMLTDVVMAYTLVQTWETWPGVCSFFAKPMDEIARLAAKRAFKLAYTENYKHRQRIRRDMDSPVTLLGKARVGAVINPVTISTYLLDHDSRVTLVDEEVIMPPEEKRMPMPPEFQARFDDMMRHIGQTWERDEPLRSKNPKHRAGVPLLFPGRYADPSDGLSDTTDDS